MSQGREIQHYAVWGARREEVIMGNTVSSSETSPTRPMVLMREDDRAPQEASGHVYTQFGLSRLRVRGSADI